MKSDIRNTPLFGEIERLFDQIRRPGQGCVSDASEVHVSPAATEAVFSGAVVDRLEGDIQTRIQLCDLNSAKLRALTEGPGVDRSPKFSPQGDCIAFLSDRHTPGAFQLYLIAHPSGVIRSALPVDGWVEYFHWSADGRRILLGVAGHGAHLSGNQGAVASRAADVAKPEWAPTIDTGSEDFHWRSVWILDVAAETIRRVPTAGLNIWEATWCGADEILAIASDQPREGFWYRAGLYRINSETAEHRLIHQPTRQAGWPSASASGERIAVVEALCSDRYSVAGDLMVACGREAEPRRIDTGGIDVTYTEWRAEHRLLIAGHRGFETVVALFDASTNVLREIWKSDELTAGPRYISVAGIGSDGDCALVGESFRRAPELAVVRDGHYHAVRSFDLGYSQAAKMIGAVEKVEWQAADDLSLQGWLLLPDRSGPHPMVVNIHGGPIAHWRPRWLGHSSIFFPMLALIARGFAVFLPNMRGSSGRGQEFAQRILGDMGGAETDDFLSGIDHLVERGVADPAKVGLLGGSYGGFMTAWLITQDQRFAAAVPFSPVTNYVTGRIMSNIPQFYDAFLGDSFMNSGGRYYERSPIMHVHKVRTPTLNIAGALDRCTPPEESIQFHNALLENGVPSTLVIYPQEGHGIRKLPAILDYTARIVGWFAEHMPPAGLRPGET